MSGGPPSPLAVFDLDVKRPEDFEQATEGLGVLIRALRTQNLAIRPHGAHHAKCGASAAMEGDAYASRTGYLCLAVAVAGWTRTDVEHTARTALGMEHYRTRRNVATGLRESRKPQEAASRLGEGPHPRQPLPLRSSRPRSIVASYGPRSQRPRGTQARHRQTSTSPTQQRT